MAHMINQLENGSAGYIGREAAWHALGNVTGKFMTTQEIFANCENLRYDVEMQQLYDASGTQIGAYGLFKKYYDFDQNGRKVYRDERRDFLASCGKSYGIINHDDGFGSADALVTSKDGAYWETAGVLGNGERVWGLINLGQTINVGDDIHNVRLLFATSYNGTMAHLYKGCDERAVCHNTVTIALSEETNACLKIRHTKNAAMKLADATKALASFSHDVQGLSARLNFLAGRLVNKESMVAILDRLFPKTARDSFGELKGNTTRRENILADVLRIYEDNDDNAFREQRGTAYNLLNAITNYTDHERSSRGDNRAESAMFGTGDQLKSKAYDVIYEYAGGMEAKPQSVYVDFAELGLNVPGLV